MSEGADAANAVTLHVNMPSSELQEMSKNYSICLKYLKWPEMQRFIELGNGVPNRAVGMAITMPTQRSCATSRMCTMEPVIVYPSVLRSPKLRPDMDAWKVIFSLFWTVFMGPTHSLPNYQQPCMSGRKTEVSHITFCWKKVEIGSKCNAFATLPTLVKDLV